MAPTLRTSVAADRAAVLALAARLADFTLPPGRTAAEIAAADVHLFDAFYAAPDDDTLFLVAEDGGTVLGTVLANIGEDYFTHRPFAYVEVLAVAEEQGGH